MVNITFFKQSTSTRFDEIFDILFPMKRKNKMFHNKKYNFVVKYSKNSQKHDEVSIYLTCEHF